jgi:hypothetical protein
MQVKEFKIASYVNLGLASWLLCSAYVWRHDGVQFLSTVLVGALVAIVAPFEVMEFSGSPKVRKVTAAAGIALTASALLLPRISAATAWHNAILGLAIAVVSLLGPPHATWFSRPRRSAT